MLNALIALLLTQLAGEALARGLGLPLPGPVLGMLFLLAAFRLWPGLADRVRPAAQGILANLSLLFVPAGVGVVGHIGRIGTEGAGLLLALALSTALAIAVGALAFVTVARLTGSEPGE